MTEIVTKRRFFQAGKSRSHAKRDKGKAITARRHFDNFLHYVSRERVVRDGTNHDPDDVGHTRKGSCYEQTVACHTVGLPTVEKNGKQFLDRQAAFDILTESGTDKMAFQTWIVSPDPAKMKHIPHESWERGIFESAIQAIQEYRDETYGEGNEVIAAGWYHDKKTADGQEQPHIHLLVNTRVQDDVRGTMTEDFNIRQLETFNALASQSLDHWMERELGHERYADILSLYHAEQAQRENDTKEERNRDQRERRARMKKEREDAKRAEREMVEIAFHKPPAPPAPVVEIIAPLVKIATVENTPDEEPPERLQLPTIATPVEPMDIIPKSLPVPAILPPASKLPPIEPEPPPRKRTVPPLRGGMYNPMTLKEIAREEMRERYGEIPWWKQLLNRFQTAPALPKMPEPITMRKTFTKEEEILANANGFDLSDSPFGQPKSVAMNKPAILPKPPEVTQVRSLPEPVSEPDIEEDEEDGDEQEIADEYDWDIDF